MLNRNISIHVIVLAWVCLFCLRTPAQTMIPMDQPFSFSGRCVQSNTFILMAPPRIPTWECKQLGDSMVLCEWVDDRCAPPAAQDETQCQACTAIGAQPVNLATGNVFITQTDVSLPGRVGGLHLTRTWNSTWPKTQVGMMPFVFGPNWTSTYQERAYVGTDGYVKYARSDGSFWSLGQSSSSASLLYATAAPANAGATAVLNADGSWTITLKNGEKRTFSSVAGSLSSITDRNGNTTTLSYDSANRLTTVTDPSSRHLYFNYGTDSAFYLVSSVTSDVGLTVSYSYDSRGRLLQVTKPDKTTLSFQYDNNSNITAVLDNEGKILESHTYDNLNRGLTSSRANGVESITVQYPTPPALATAP
jgi:YD repeat-containing protein